MEATHPTPRASGASAILYAIASQSVSLRTLGLRLGRRPAIACAIIADGVLARRDAAIGVWVVRARCDSMPAFRRTILSPRLIPVFLLAFCVSVELRAGPLETAAGQLASAIVRQLPAGLGVGLELRNLSSLTEAEAAAARRALEAELRNRGVTLLAADLAPIRVRVTLSENLQSYLWVAEIRRGDSAEVVLLPVQRPTEGPGVAAGTAMEIRKQLVWVQTDPILDLALLESPARAPTVLLVLESARLALYNWENNRWVAGQSFAIPRFQAWAREDRGWLSVSGDAVAASVPGTSCHGTWRGAAGLSCQQIAQPWVPSLGSQQSGSANRIQPPAFSYAIVSEKSKPLTLAAGLDGLTRLYEEGPNPVASFAGWGSDIVGISSGCGSGTQVLVTGTGDDTRPDTIRAYEIRDRQPVAVSAPAEFPGPVTALWPFSDGASAVAVARNLATGLYEAYRLSLACNP